MRPGISNCATGTAGSWTTSSIAIAASGLWRLMVRARLSRKLMKTRRVTTPGIGHRACSWGALLLNGAASGTIRMWVKWTGAQDADCCSSFGAVFARQANGVFSDDILALNTSNPDTARVVWRQSGGPAPVLITGTTPVGTNWHHIAVTFANSGSTLYID